MRIFQFRSDLFPVDPNEDDETNPFCYGKSLAEWVKNQFTALGYEMEPVIAEDWGWCVMLQRRPFMLWIGCQNELPDDLDSTAPEHKERYSPKARNLTWMCFVGTDTPIWNSFFWKRLIGLASTKSHIVRAHQELEMVLRNEPRIQFIDNE